MNSDFFSISILILIIEFRSFVNTRSVHIFACFSRFQLSSDFSCWNGS